MTADQLKLSTCGVRVAFQQHFFTFGVYFIINTKTKHVLSLDILHTQRIIMQFNIYTAHFNKPQF